MTREEAIKLLVNATYSDEWQWNEDLTTAYNMAIKALEQEEIVRCKDCKHRPVKTDTQIVPPDGLRDETCPCINENDWWYSYMPEDYYFCAYGEKMESKE